MGFRDQAASVKRPLKENVQKRLIYKKVQTINTRFMKKIFIRNIQFLNKYTGIFIKHEKNKQIHFKNR